MTKTIRSFPLSFVAVFIDYFDSTEPDTKREEGGGISAVSLFFLFCFFWRKHWASDNSNNNNNSSSSSNNSNNKSGNETRFVTQRFVTSLSGFWIGSRTVRNPNLFILAPFSLEKKKRKRKKKCANIRNRPNKSKQINSIIQSVWKSLKWPVWSYGVQHQNEYRNSFLLLFLFKKKKYK